MDSPSPDRPCGLLVEPEHHGVNPVSAARASIKTVGQEPPGWAAAELHRLRPGSRLVPWSASSIPLLSSRHSVDFKTLKIGFRIVRIELLPHNHMLHRRGWMGGIPEFFRDPV